jgi:GNAT superfamily N-acetyltransferase
MMISPAVASLYGTSSVTPCPPDKGVPVPHRARRHRDRHLPRCPASLTLTEFWLVRDMYVVPAQRGRGVARGLLDVVTAAAQAQGAIRLSLQMELDNTDALRLYLAYGFRPVTGLYHLVLDLTAD